MASSAVKAVAVAAVLLVVLAGWARGKADGDAPTVVSGSWEETYEVAPADRAAGLRFAPGVAPADQRWIAGSIAAARPEAQMLIEEVDGLIEVHTHVGDPFGVTEVKPPTGYVMGLDIGAMDRDRVQDRESTVLHELGHVVDHALVTPVLNRTLDEGIPRGSCTSAHGLTGSCTAPEERFADTFAKWALRGAVSEAGAGYGVASPASLEDWGAPLARLAIEVSTRALTGRDNAPVARLVVSLLLAALALPGAAAAEVRLPDGVRLQPAATGIPHPSNLAFDGRGRLWVTSAGIQAAAADGVWLVARPGARPRQVVAGLFSALGLTWHRGVLYVSHVVPNATFAPRHTGRVVAFSRFDGRRFRSRRVVVDGLPVGQHRVDSLAAGRDGRLYLGIGSQEDHARPRRRLSAAVVSFRPGGGGLRVEARGLRNPYGLAFLPGGRRLLVSEHGRDDLGPMRPPDEVNVVDPRGRVRWHGFPGCWHQGGAACRGARAPLVRLRAHSAPGAIAVSDGFGRFGPSAFVTRFGSSFPGNPSGGDVVRIPLDGPGGAPRRRAERFATGFGLREPLGAAIGPGGALHVSLWSSGRVVRLVPEAAAAAARPPDALAIVLGWIGRVLGLAGTSGGRRS